MIAACVSSLVRQDYPADRFDVHVVADNCTDDTAEAASVAGAQVHARTDPSNPGKGAALNWLIDRVVGTGVDAVVVVDADTTTDSGLLNAFDAALVSGAKAVQAYYGVNEPGTSAAVGLRFAAIACRHHVRPLGRTNLGASCGLYGNGMAFRADLMAGRRWSDHLVEDAEFQLDLLLDGHMVTYAPDGVVLAEMPSSLEGGTSQNERWELGRLQLMRRYLRPLAYRAALGGPLPRRVYVDAVADLVTPPLSVLALLDATTVSLGAAAVVIRPRRRHGLTLAMGLASSAILAAHVIVGLRLVDAPADVYRSLRSAPRAILWKLLLLARITQRPQDVAWTRTTRNVDRSRSAG